MKKTPIRSKMKVIALSLFLVVFAAGCATNEMYYWGDYEDIIYRMYNNPDKQTAGDQITKLSKNIKQALKAGKPVPPGVYAHLGFMYALIGNQEGSESAFSKEIEHFPESAKMIEGMLARASKSNQNTDENQ